MIEMPPDAPWRTGSKRYRRHDNHRTLYVQLADEPDEMDPMIGVMDTPELADIVVRTRAALADLIRLQDGPWDDAAQSEKIEAWCAARRVLAHWIRLPDDV